MPLIESSLYNDVMSPTWEPKKFDQLRYTIVGSADYTVLPVVNTAWNYTLVVSASASAIGGGLSAGGLNSLRTTFAKTTAVRIVTDEALTATAWMRSMRIVEKLNPTYYVVSVNFARVP